MTDSDDPFKRIDVTAPRPRPAGGRRSPADAPPVSRVASLSPSYAESIPALREFVAPGLNPLVQAASPLLLLAGRLRTTLSAPDVNDLRRQALDEIRRFEERARSSGVPNEIVLAARYALCAALDEAVLSTPWGAHGEWAQQTLLVNLHREAWGGEKFFELLDRISRDPARHIDLMELQYLCLAFGFGGKYQVLERGSAQLAEVQRDLYRRIRDQRGAPETELSVQWRGVEDRRNPVIRYVPWWVVGIAALAALAVVFAVSYARLGNAAAPVQAGLANVGLESFNVPPVKPVQAVVAGPTLKQLLTAEEARGALSVEEEGDGRTVVTMLAPDLFASGDATANPQYLGVLQRVAAALAQVPGRVLVVGHTDDQPLRSLRYADNFQLSRERAVSVVRILQGAGNPARFEWTGVGSSSTTLPPGVSPRQSRTQSARGDHPRARFLKWAWVWLQCSCRTQTWPIGGDMLALLKPRALLVALGLVLVGLFVWYAGPYFAFADWHPLESPNARLIVFLAVIACWIVSILAKRLRANRAGIRLLVEAVRPSKDEPRPSADAVQLRERFEDAIATLKQQQRRGQSLYELPWYVFIGAPGSGKTTALINSGLRFPLEQRLGKGALRGVGGTRNCDWWFTEEAVFLDTAGRYTTQDSDAAADSAGWAEFLALLRTYRHRRPLNGVLLTISAQDLMVQGQGARETHVAAIRRRLDELNQQLRIRLPVYLIVTKCDLIAGFAEYFDDLAQEGRAQVWGVTFPYEQTLKGEAARALPAQFDGLMARLNARLFARLEEEHDVARRTKMFGFPQQMAALRDVLSGFVTDVFASTRFDRQVPLRGVYFTSGTQEGTPIDRLLMAIGRRFAMAPGAVAPASGRGKAYFIDRVLKEVVLPESGLAGVNQRLEMQKAAVQLGLYAATVLIAAVGIGALLVSYGRNQAYIAQVSTDLAGLRQTPPVPGARLPDMLLPRLDAVRAVADSANRYQDQIPWLMRWGLYQGVSIGTAASDAYARELDGALLPQVAARLQERLIAYAPEPEKLYEYLKAYLMLGQPERLDKAHLEFLVDLEWKTAYASEPAKAASLNKHFRGLLDYEDTLRPLALDQSLVAQARSTIQRASIPRLIYSRLKLNTADDTTRSLRLDVAAGVGADRVLRRKSGVSLSTPLPSLYTAPVFKDITSGGTDQLVKQFAADRWVWGGVDPQFGDSAKLAAEVVDLYEQDYIAAWDAVLSDIELVSFANTADALAILAAPTSPLRGLLQTVDANTSLVRPPDPTQPGGTLSSAQQALNKLFTKGKEAVGIPTVTPGLLVTAHFAPIHQLMAGPPGGAPIDRILGEIGQVQKLVVSLGSGAGETRSLDAVGSPQLNSQLRALQQDAATLPTLVQGLVTQITTRTSGVVIAGATSELEGRYRQDVVRECSAVVGNRYPFAPGSSVDVPLDDFGRLFGYGGVFESFFNANLAKLVDTSRTPWTWRPGSVNASAAMLREFEAAQRVREIFFRPGSQKPELRFIVTPIDLDASANRFLLELDGQPFDYRHGPERNASATWPGPNPGMAAATFEDRSGARPNRVFEGQWAWFRLVDVAQVQRETETRALLRFEMGGHTARVRVDSTSIHNPYVRRDWQQFRCGA